MTTVSATSMIVSQAFRYLKLAPVSSFDDDSDQARAAAQMYPVALRACLEVADWSFASVVVALPQKELGPHEVADDLLPYTYGVPGDFVAMRLVGDGTVRWRIDRGNLLRADMPGPLPLRYTALIDQEASLPASFQAAVAAQLACYLAPVHAEATTHADWLEGLLANEMTKAKRADRVAASVQRFDGGDARGYWADEVTR